jgi:putative nucleotidyltransferase with HDIG domain
VIVLLFVIGAISMLISIYSDQKKAQNTPIKGLSKSHAAANNLAEKIKTQQNEANKNIFFPKTYSALTEEEKKQIMDDLKNIPALPSAGQQVLTEMRNRKSSAESVAEIAQSDPTLVGEVLRMANSAYYAQSKKVTTVRQAVVIMGFRTIQDLIIQKDLIKLFKQPSDGGYNYTELWTHSLACSLIANYLARQSHRSSDFISTLGLLHDIGKFAMNTLYPDKVKELLSPSDKYAGLDMLQKEENIFGYNHAVYGCALAHTWKLPEEICLAIENHHHPMYLSKEKIPGNLLELVTLVYFADQSAKYLQVFGGNTEIDMGSDGYFFIIGLEPPLDNLIDNKVEQLAAEAKTFIASMSPKK